MKHFTKVNILGINFLNITQQAFLNTLEQEINLHHNCFVVTANPEIVLLARKNHRYQQIINHADYVTADGIGIIKGAKILNQPLPERITGYDTMLNLLDFANRNHKKVYFLGAQPAVIKALIPIIQQKYPQLIIAGFHDGYFKDPQPILTEIKAAQPDIVFAALGFPKQEYFINQYREVSNSLWMGVGGSFDVLAGKVKRAPQFWLKGHIEWLHRLIQEASRLRSMLALPKYLILIYREKFAQHKKRKA